MHYEAWFYQYMDEHFLNDFCSVYGWIAICHSESLFSGKNRKFSLQKNMLQLIYCNHILISHLHCMAGKLKKETKMGKIDWKCFCNLLNVVSCIKPNSSNFWFSSRMSGFKIAFIILNCYKDSTVNTCALAMSSVTFSDISLCLFVWFLLKCTFLGLVIVQDNERKPCECPAALQNSYVHSILACFLGLPRLTLSG